MKEDGRAVSRSPQSPVACDAKGDPGNTGDAACRIEWSGQPRIRAIGSGGMWRRKLENGFHERVKHAG